MFNFGYITKENIKEHNPNWPEIPDHPYRILIITAKYLSPLSKNEFTITNTLSFPELLKKISNDESFEYVLSDVEYLFTSIPV